jgi:DNA repair protein RecN (Recombination protein N)
MQAGERIREDISKAGQALSLQGAEGLLSDARRWLQGVEAKAEGRLTAPLAALERVAIELDTAQRGVEDCLLALDFNPHELELLTERLFAIRGLARKHGVLPDALADHTAKLRADLAEIEAGEKDLTDLQAILDKARADFDAAAENLSATRQKAARKLDTAMAAELAPLKMERAVFTTELSRIEAGPDGLDAVQFTVATNPGAPSGALNKIASGGELSRFLLALKVCLSARAEGLTMIFDEIDRGVGGATADAVGRRLAALASGGQVLVVTHSPQVAALGDHHWVVEKQVSGKITRTTVSPVTGDARTAEVARMLAGDTVTDQAKAAAEVLLRAQ